jgi:hypothetical protein
MAEEPKVPEGSVSFAVPDAPAFTYLEATPTQITRPGSARDLNVEVLNGLIDSSGRINRGVAIDVRPWILIPGLNIPLETYRHWLYYALANTQLSLATLQATLGAGVAPGDVDLAVGFRTTLVDRGDPMLNTAYVESFGNGLSGCAPSAPGGDAAAQEACLRQVAEKIREKWLDDHWNAFRLTLGFAAGWRAPESFIKDANWRGLAGWLVGGGGFGRYDQLIFQVRYDREQLLKTNEIGFGGRFNLGTARVNAFAELLGHLRPGAPAGVDRFDANWSAGIEVRVAEKTWLSTGCGRSFATDQKNDPVVLIAGLKWAIANEARLQTH